MVDFKKKLKEYEAVKAGGKGHGSITDRLRKSIKAVQPNVNMNPRSAEPEPPAKVEEVVPRLVDVISTARERLQLQNLITERYQGGIYEKEAKARNKHLSEQIKKIMGENDIGKLDYDDYRVNFFGSGRPYIDKNALLAAGVTPQVIEACTKRSSFSVVRVTLRGQPEDEE